MDESGNQVRREGPWLYRLVATVVAVLVVPFVRIDARRLDVARRYKTGIVVTNHRSFFDVAVGLVVFRRLRRYPRVIVAAHWFDRRGIGMLLRLAGAIPMDRDDPAGYLAEARRMLDADIPILILPEGTLSGEPGVPTSVGRFKTGAARLAHHCEVPVWMLAIVGADEVWPRGRQFPRLNPFRRRHVLVLGAENMITVNDDVGAATVRIRDGVVDLLHDTVELRATRSR